MGEMTGFRFRGPVPASKSLMNRALIVKSYFSDLLITGDTDCEDVKYLKRALQVLKSGASDHRYYCGDGGTTFRFLLARLSRISGEHYITGSERLLSRPHQGLLRALEQLGVSVIQETDKAWVVRSEGWQWQQPIELDASRSSQYASALLLNAWLLPEPLVLQWQGEAASESYLQMTIELLRSLGMQIDSDKSEIRVPPGQKLTRSRLTIEPDMSSLFSLAACAVANGQIEVSGVPATSLQPDFRFIELLQEMNANLEFDKAKGLLRVQTSPQLKPVDVNLHNQPDLFPVLAVLLSRAEGPSIIGGIENLIHKESNRLQNILDLLGDLGFQCTYQYRKFYLQGKRQHNYPRELVFDPDQDHRMVMAATVAELQGAPIQIVSPQLVNKSFPGFLEALGGL